MAVEKPGQWDLPGEGPASSEQQLLVGGAASRDTQEAGAAGGGVGDCDHLAFND